MAPTSDAEPLKLHVKGMRRLYGRLAPLPQVKALLSTMPTGEESQEELYGGIFVMEPFGVYQPHREYQIQVVKAVVERVESGGDEVIEAFMEVLMRLVMGEDLRGVNFVGCVGSSSKMIDKEGADHDTARDIDQGSSEAADPDCSIDKMNDQSGIDQDMDAFSSFKSFFQGGNEDQLPVVTILEDARLLFRNGTTGLRTWPAGEEFSRWLVSRGSQVAGVIGRRVLELGSGSGLVGVTLGLLGARVTATDCDSQVLTRLRGNVRRNGVAGVVRVERLAWIDCDEGFEGFSVAVAGSHVLTQAHPQAQSRAQSRLQSPVQAPAHSKVHTRAKSLAYPWSHSLGRFEALARNHDIIVGTDLVYDNDLAKQLAATLVALMARPDSTIQYAILALTRRSDDSILTFERALDSYSAGTLLWDSTVLNAPFELFCISTSADLLRSLCSSTASAT